MMKRWIWGLCMAGIFFLGVGGAAPCHAAGWQPLLRVGLLQGQQAVTIQLNQEGTATAGKKSAKLPANRAVSITLRDGAFLVDGKAMEGDSLDLLGRDEKQQAQLVARVNQKSYRGGIRLIRKGNAFAVVNLVPAEAYLWGVIPKEMPSDWPEEALKAQAVAARTFALKNRKRHEAEGFDLCTTTHCQVYEGVAGEYAKTNAVAQATYGEVLFGKDGLIDAPFHTDSGGMTENSEDVWGAYSPYLRAAKERHVNTEPWEASFAVGEFQRKLETHGIRVGAVKKIELSPLHVGQPDKDRSASGRVKSLRIVGADGTRTVSGGDMRSIFGLKSTLFEAKMAGGKVTLSGFGWGHGLGMSQWGARAYAAEMGYAEILAHYYRNTTIKKLY